MNAGNDGLSALKDLADLKRIFAAGASGDFWGVLDAHQDMCERQQFQQLAANSHASLALQQDALRRSEEREAALLAQAQDAEARLQAVTASLHEQQRRQAAEEERNFAEQRRRAALPKCPDCHTPLEETRPRRCAACRVELVWIAAEPLTHETAIAVARSGWRVASVLQCKDELAAAATRLAGALCAVSVHGFTTEAACKSELRRRQKLLRAVEQSASKEASDGQRVRDLLQQRIDQTQQAIKDNAAEQLRARLDFGSSGQERRSKTDHARGKLIRELSKHIAALESHRTEEASRNRINVKRKHAVVDGPPTVEQLKLVCVRAQEARESMGKYTEVLEVVQSVRSLLQGDVNSMPSVLELPAQAEADPPPKHLGQSLAVRLPGERSYRQIDISHISSWINEQSLGVELVKVSGRSGVTLIRQMLPDYFSATGDLRLLRKLLKDGVPKITAPTALEIEGRLLELILPGLCVVASADGVVRSAELKRMVAILQEKGCEAEGPAIEQLIVDVCRRIHKQGVAQALQEITSTLRPYVGHPLNEVFLELAEIVALSDGKIGSRESQCLQFFRQNLVSLPTSAVN